MIVRSNDLISSGRRSGITLTEILISIMIMGIGMVSLATLFPLGLLRLRDASRLSRSTYLAESATADLAVRGLLNPASFAVPESLNVTFGFRRWYVSPNAGPYDPLVQDTPSYGGEWRNNAGNALGARGSNGQGLPFAYDPLWRYQTAWNSQANWGVPTGIYLDPLNRSVPEARFASGIGFVRPDPAGGLPSAHGLQRLTNFHTPMAVIGNVDTFIMPVSRYVPSIFVSPEDMVWQDPAFQLRYPMAGSLSLTDPASNSNAVDPTPSSLIPDLSQDRDILGNPLPLFDWRYSWMFTGRQISAGTSGATLDGEIVIFENRPLALDSVTNQAPYPTQFTGAGAAAVQAAGERVVEAVFGYSSNVIPVGNDGNNLAFGYGTGAGRTVMLRWPAATPDPEIKVGNWIADVTYERSLAVSTVRFGLTSAVPARGSPPSGQRCHWYQITKVNPSAPAAGNLTFGSNDGDFRYMIVNVATPLRAFTQLDINSGSPVHVNAALISPHVIQVIPRTFTVN